MLGRCRAISALLLVSSLAFGQKWMTSPSKVSIETTPASPQAGDPINVVLKLLNNQNNPAAAPSDVQVIVQMAPKGGHAVSTSCRIPRGSSSGNCTLDQSPSGVVKIQAVPQNRELLGATKYIVVRSKGSGRSDLAPLRDSFFGVRIIRAAFDAPESLPTPAQPTACAAPLSHGAARMMVVVNDGGEAGGAFRAGLDAATVTAVFDADDGGSAPSNIRVLLTSDHGQFDDATGILIPVCQLTGSARLESQVANQISITCKVSPANYPIEEPRLLSATFITPIVGIRVLSQGTQTMSLVDRAYMSVQFFDQSGKSVATDIRRTVNFATNNPAIGLQRLSVDVQPGQDTADNTLTPNWPGEASIFVTSDHLQSPDPHPVQVTWSAVYVCLIGSILGGLVAFVTGGGKVLSRILCGMAGGVVFSWLYIFGIAGKISWDIAHNGASVFVFALLGGYLGVKAIDLALSKIGWSPAPGRS